MKRCAMLLAAGLLLAGCANTTASLPAVEPDASQAVVSDPATTETAVSVGASGAATAQTESTPAPTAEPEPYVKVRCTVEQNGTKISTLNPAYTGVTVYYYDGDGNLLHEQEVQTDGRDRYHLACTYEGSSLIRAESWYENTLLEYETYTIDEAGRPVRKVVTTVTSMADDPDIQTDYAYDEAGRLTGETMTRLAGSGLEEAVTGRTSYTYDEAGLCVRQDDSNADGELMQQTIWTYDENGNPTRKEYTTAGSSAATVTTYTYDEAGRLTEQTVNYGSGLSPETVTYTYDDAGNLQTETYADAGTGEIKQTMTYEWKPLSQALADQQTLAITDADSGLVLRAGAGTDQAKIDTMPKASAVVLLETTTAADGSNWARVRYGDQEGYCSADYLLVE